MVNQHGGMVYDKSVELDFSVNINPLGMPEEVKQSIIENVNNFETYPDTECIKLRQRLSQVERVPFKNIVCGNGADDIIFRLSKVLNPRCALILSPTFSEYERSLDCIIKYYPLKSHNDFKVQVDVLEYLNGVDVFYLCNPNNPTGMVLDKSLMDLIVERCLKEGITLVVDECFLDFVIEGVSFKRYLDSGLNLIILKAFTKIYSMAGVRLGYAMFSNSKVCEDVSNCGQTWSVSSVAQVCGLSALNCTDYIEKTQKYVEIERNFLKSSLESLGLKVYPSVANYVLVQSKLDLYNPLLKDKILIRECSNYIGLNDSYFRIAVKSHRQNVILIDSIKRILKE